MQVHYRRALRGRYVQNRPASSRADKTSRVLEQQNQLPLVRRRWLETETSIKGVYAGTPENSAMGSD